MKHIPLIAQIEHRIADAIVMLDNDDAAMAEDILRELVSDSAIYAAEQRFDKEANQCSNCGRDLTEGKHLIRLNNGEIDCPK